jgi:hypothetical protein
VGLEAHIGCSAAKNSIIFLSVVDPDSLNPNPDTDPAFEVNPIRIRGFDSKN